MVMHLCTEVVAASLPFPVVDVELPDDLGLDDVRQVIGEERDRQVERLQMALDEGIITDPLLTELAEARADRERADARIRRLVAYGREFPRPRPYPLAQLAAAAGMSISGVRTCYSETDTEIVEQNIGRRPVTRIGADPATTGVDRA